MTHPWKSSGDKRTVVAFYEPTDEVIRYLEDMRDAVYYGMVVAYQEQRRNNRYGLPSPIRLRALIKDWFCSRYTYARHHVNPVCRTAVALLRSYRKKHHGQLKIPTLTRLAMKVDSSLFKLVHNQVRITIQPKHYAWLPINVVHKHFDEYSRGKPSEVLLTDTKICLTFVVGVEHKPIGRKFIATDINFGTLDTTVATTQSGVTVLENTNSESIGRIGEIQSDFARRRTMIQKHVRNPQKRNRKLAECRGRQRNRIKDALHKVSTQQVRKNPGTSFIFENLKGIRKSGETKGLKFRTTLNRWPYHMYQSLVDYKSPNRTIYASPRGTSSECPVCGGKLEHPTWAVSRCVYCGVDYDRNRLASLAILRRGLRLCGQPFAVSADPSWKALRDEYLYTAGVPAGSGAGWTEPPNAPNENLGGNARV